MWHRSRQKRGHRDSVTNKTIGAVCSPQERRAAAAKTRCGVNRNVVAGDAAVLRTKLRARLPRPGRSPPTGGGTALWHRSRQKRGHRDSVTNKTIGAICSPREPLLRQCREENRGAACSPQGVVYKKILLLPPNVNDIGQGRGVFPTCCHPAWAKHSFAPLISLNAGYVPPYAFRYGRKFRRPAERVSLHQDASWPEPALSPWPVLSSAARKRLLFPLWRIYWLYQGRLRRKRRESAALFHAAGIDNISPV